MALDIYGPNSHVANDSCDLALFEAARRLNCMGPVLESIEREFYGKLTVEASSVPALRAELASLQHAYRSEIEPRIAKAKKVHASDPEQYNSILLPILQRESPLFHYICAFLEVCDDALEHAAAVRFSGD